MNNNELEGIYKLAREVIREKDERRTLPIDMEEVPNLRNLTRFPRESILILCGLDAGEKVREDYSILGTITLMLRVLYPSWEIPMYDKAYSTENKGRKSIQEHKGHSMYKEIGRLFPTVWYFDSILFPDYQEGL